MLKMVLKLFKKEDVKKDKVDLFLEELRKDNISFPGDYNHFMEQFIREGIEKGFIKIEEC
ncbi:hypothetical protein [Clostridium botulinum]|uniref:hypothetical protein n=1 Tax=Clostridium botulinum TaxID=1491 RepID=UPI0004D00DE2|nr:hypothetical protein [Clostridium botulinum]APC82244.1 hypothetical protein NPD12_3720 [Clostridium botulinum]AXG97779.1 hypothetical protein AGE31_19515 [Clostridium botulinum]MBY6773576.1 hypothetical protein [Clostridium botulinum]MBY6886005.1 hypothetical protein [Clostridium botulinum]